MFWFGFWCGIISILMIMTIITTISLIIAYKGAPLAEDEE
jgi:hypothetical protein